MAQAVEGAGEGGGGIAHRSEAGATVPACRVAGVDVRAQRIVPTQVTRHPLQVLAGGAAGGAQVGDHGVVDGVAIATDLGGEVLPGLQVDRGIDAVLGGATVNLAVATALAVFQCQLAAVALGGVEGGVDLYIAVGVEREGVAALPGDGVVNEDVAVAGAGCDGLQGDAVVGQVVGECVGADAAVGLPGGPGADGEVGGVDEPFTGLALVGAGGDPGFVGDLDLGRAGFDKAAVAALGVERAGGAGVQVTRHPHRAVVHVAHQADFAVLAGGQGSGPGHAGVVDDAGGEIAGGLGGQIDQTAVGADGAALLDQGVQAGFLHLDADRATQVQGDGAAGAHQGAAARGGNVAGVDDLGGDHGHQPALGGADVAPVNNSVGAVAAEAVVAVHEVVGGDIQRGGHQGAHVHPRGGGKVHAVGVDQKYPAVGFDGAANGGHLAAGDPVEGGGIPARLIEADGVALTHGKAPPVDGGVVAGLVDGERIALATDAGITRHYPATVRQGAGPGGEGDKDQQQRPRGHSWRRGPGHTARAPGRQRPPTLPATGFGGCLPDPPANVPDHLVHTVHAAMPAHRGSPLLALNSRRRGNPEARYRWMAAVALT